MNFRFSLFFSFLFVVLSSQAQRSLIFEENFDDNFLRWMNGSSSEYGAEVADGYYNIEYKQEQGVWYFWQSIPVHPDTSFYIESKIAPFLKSTTSVYGLIWGVKDVNNYNAYLISNMGKTSVVTCRNGQFTKIVDWTITGNYQNNQYHNIGIRQKGGELHYYLDGTKAFTTPILNFCGDLLGFVISGKTNAKVDYLRVLQDRSINLVENSIQGNQKINLGSSINSPYTELHPVIAPDGQSIYVTRSGHPENEGIDKRDDAWVAYKQADGSWGNIQNMGAPINNNNYNHVISVSPDNNTILLGNTYHHNGMSKGKGVSISHRKEDGTWEIPQDVIIDNFYNQNPIHSVHLAANKQLLLMSIERNDSYGHLDLHVSFLQKNGHFSQPKNLGPTINTAYEDGTPFLAADGKTLYFSSSGHGGYGSTDIFVSRRLDDTWRNWSEPQNLGPEINSHDWEGYYSITASGSTAYLVSTRGENHLGAEDIYQVVPPVGSRPDPVLMVKGKIFNASTKEPLRAQVQYFDLKDNKELGDALSNSSDGKYQVVLPADNQYSFLTYKNGYYPVSESIEVGKITDYTEVVINLAMYPIEEGEDIPLRNVFFLGNTNELAVQSYPELDRLALFMEKYPEMTIDLVSNNTKKNESIKKHLLDKKINPERILSKVKEDKKESSFTILALTQYDETVHRLGNFNEEIVSNNLQKGQIFRLNNTFFAADSSYITPNAAKELLQLKTFLTKNPSLIIEVSGHTNGLPDDDYCDKLSTDRAKNVTLFLHKHGVAPKQIQYKGYGKRLPIATNETLQGRQKNQRVEIKILEVGTISKKDEK